MSISVNYASIQIGTEGTPESIDFGDVYFSRNNGIEESAYVFLQQNRLPERWRYLDDGETFTIAETGFGTGLNFLLSWKAFETHAPAGAKLHFVSFEKYPISPDFLARAHQAWPLLAKFASALQQNYPLNLKGIHRIHLTDRITLDLCFDDVNDALPGWADANKGQVHAWYLDGFAPGKNPDMWNDNLFHSISQSMASTASIATFTATGRVRRALIAAGINVTKVKGFGHKRDMLRGEKRIPAEPQAHIHPCATDRKQQHIVIIGGGIAAACMAMKLQDHPGPITIVYSAKSLADGASGNPQGAVYPLLQSQWNNVSELYSHSFLYARKFYDQYCPQACSWSGVQLLGHSPPTIARFRELRKAGYPDQLVQLNTQMGATQKASIDHGHCAAVLPAAGWVEPEKLVNILFNKVENYRRERRNTTFLPNVKVNQLTRNNGKWLIRSTGKDLNADHVILTTGHNLGDLVPQPLIPIRPVQGQITQVRSNALENLSQVLCHKGYITPALNGEHCIGATFNKGSINTDASDKDNQSNIDQCNAYLGTTLTTGDITSARASVRATTPDHLPVVGQAPQFGASLHNSSGLWVLSGLGSRGLTSAPWCAELLYSMMTNRPIPCQNKLLNAVLPSRFARRALRRKQSITNLK